MSGIRDEDSSLDQSSIKDTPITKDTSNVTITFNSDNSDAIKELTGSGKFGSNQEEVVIFALRFLYTVYKRRPDAKVLVAEGPSGRTYMDVKQ